MWKNTLIFSGQAAPRKFVLLASALAALFLGALVYLLDRDWATVIFLAPLAGLQEERAGMFGSLGNVLPAFCHAYAFALMLILALGCTRRARLIGALAWFAVAAGLEVLQSAPVSVLLSSLAGPQADMPLPGTIVGFAVNGRFDPYDLVAAAIGCVAAWFVASVPGAE